MHTLTHLNPMTFLRIHLCYSLLIENFLQLHQAYQDQIFLACYVNCPTNKLASGIASWRL